MDAGVTLHYQLTDQMNITDKLCQEEVVLYIAHRHRLTPQELTAYFLPAERADQTATLEDNEKEIIRELIKRN